MDALYSVMQGLESRLGGGEGVEGIYGSITATGMHKVLECMRHNCGLSRSSTLVDVGAGLGRPLLHALLLHGVSHGYGVELDKVKVAKAEAFCRGVLEELSYRGIIGSDSSVPADVAVGSGRKQATSKATPQDTSDLAGGGDQLQQQQLVQEHAGSLSERQEHSSQCSMLQSLSTDAALQEQSQLSCTSAAVPTCAGTGGDAAGGKAAVKGVQKKQNPLLDPPQSMPIITCASIEQIASLEPGTHAYSFWEGVPESGKRAFGRLFRTGHTLKAVAVVQRAIRGEAPEAYMAELGFGPLLLIKAFPVKMSGSGRSFQAYVFSKPAPQSVSMLMRCTQKQPQLEAADVPLSPTAPAHDMMRGVPELASVCKPRMQQQQQQQGVTAGTSPADASPQRQEQWPLVQLRTEASAQQQFASPSKRQQQQQASCQAAAAAAAGAGPAAGEAGSPAKKHRGSNEAAAAACAAYGLRPRQLSYCSSSGLSSRSAGSRSSSRSRTAAASCSTASTAAATATATATAAAGAGGGNGGGPRSCKSKRGNRASASAASKSMASGNTANSNARSACVSTAVSGSGSRVGQGKKATATAAGKVPARSSSAGGPGRKKTQQQQQQQQQLTTQAGTLRQQTLAGLKQQQQQGQHATVVPDVSEARRAVAALGVASTMTS